jgi:hypothetical protein
VWGRGPNDVFINAPQLQHWDGTSLKVLAFGYANVRALWTTSGWTDVLGVGKLGTIRLYNGSTAVTVGSGTTEDLQGVWGSSPTDVFAVGAAGSILHYDGTSATSIFSDPTKNLQSVWGSGPKDVFAVGLSGTILHYDGTSFTPMASGKALDFGKVSGSSPADVFITGHDVFAGVNSTLLHYDGKSFAQVALPFAPTPRFSTVWVQRGNAFLAGSAETMARLERDTVTCVGPETSCNNRWDDDCDGLADACDPDCAGQASESCANGVDDDCDGLVDCDDPDCAGFPFCSSGGNCQPFRPISCGQTASGTTVSAASRLSAYACDPRPESGPEAFYRFSTPTARNVTVTLSGFSGDLDLITIGASPSGSCDPVGRCIGASSTLAPTEQVTFAAGAGSSYFLVVDGYQGASSNFTLQVSCP